MLNFFAVQILIQLPMAEAGLLLLVIGLSFAVITLISSTARFHKMIQLGEEDLASVEDCNDFFFIQVTRYLSKINRSPSGFVVLVVQLRSERADPRPVQERMLQGLKQILREECDKACLFREDCVAAIIDTEEEKAEAVTERIVKALQQLAEPLPEVSAFRAGGSTFPAHGLNTQRLVDTATDVLEQADFESPLPLQLAPPPMEAGEHEKIRDDSDPEVIGEISREDKNAALDPLTGVLKPTVVGSYMRKYLLEIRRKKTPASVLCIGINRIDNIIGLHGEAAADAVIAQTGKLLQQVTRDCDLIARFHRDDFLILAPCTLEQGEMIAIRIREAVQKKTFLFEGKRLKTSVGIGISAHPEHGKNLHELFGGAYAALGIVREWNTSSCLVYNPAKHSKKKINHESTS